MAKTKTGIQPSIWSKEMSPTSSAPPHLKKTTSRPYAAPIESRLRMIAFSGISSRAERAQEQDVGEQEHPEHEPRERPVREVEEVDPARRAAAREDVDAVREARRRDDVVAQPVDEVERGRRPVLALADHVQRGSSGRSGRRSAGLGSKVTRRPRDRREPSWSAPSAPARAGRRRRRPARCRSTIAVGASAPSPSSSETMFRPWTPSRSCGMPSFEPGPTSSLKTGSARRTRNAVVVAATTTGARMIVRESRTTSSAPSPGARR